MIPLFLLDTHCATIQQPTGGPKDSIPPEIIKESPKNLTINFKEKKIVLELSEFTKMQNEFQQISIVPDMSKRPVFKINKKNIIITLPDSLEKNTTYTINFGEAIVDYNEGNKLGNYTYVFSTGPEIDSLSISGTVTDAIKAEKEIGTTVILIPLSQDSIFGKKKANIFTKTDSSGSFKVNHLKENEYHIYALNEGETGGDRIYNSEKESIAFLDTTIILKKDSIGLRLLSSVNYPKTFRTIDKKIEKNGRILYSFNQGLEDPKITFITPVEEQEKAIIKYDKEQDTAYLWLPELNMDSLKVAITAKNINKTDTITIRRTKNDKYDRRLTVTNNIDNQHIDKVTHLVLTASSPIDQINPSQISLLEDSVAIPNFKIIKDTTDNQKIKLTYNWKPEKHYDINLKENALIGFFGEKTIETKMSFQLDESERYGDIILSLTVPDTIGNQYLVQLVDEKKNIIHSSISIIKSQKLSYTNYFAKKYYVRIIWDENRNGKWDPGEVYKKRQPERVWYYDKMITIRPNWKQEEKVVIPQ